MTTLSLRLRAAIAASHDLIQRTPLALALQAGTLPRARYARLVEQAWRLHAAVEPACAHAAESYPPLRTLYTVERARRDALADDLRVLHASSRVAPHPAVVALVARTQRQSWDTPWALAGVLYVLEGSRLGSATIASSLARGWNVPLEGGVGLDYHLHDGDDRDAQWALFCRRLDALPVSPAQAGDVVSCARRAVEDLRRLCAELLPGDAGASDVSRTLARA